MIFFYEIAFVAVALLAAILNETWTPTAGLVLLLACWGFVALGYASFGARLAADGAGLSDEDRRWFQDARDGLRHLRLLFGLATGVALIWRLVVR